MSNIAEFDGHALGVVRKRCHVPPASLYVPYVIVTHLNMHSVEDVPDKSP